MAVIHLGGFNTGITACLRPLTTNLGETLEDGILLYQSNKQRLHVTDDKSKVTCTRCAGLAPMVRQRKPAVQAERPEPAMALRMTSSDAFVLAKLLEKAGVAHAHGALFQRLTQHSQGILAG